MYRIIINIVPADGLVAFKTIRHLQEQWKNNSDPVWYQHILPKYNYACLYINTCLFILSQCVAIFDSK